MAYYRKGNFEALLGRKSNAKKPFEKVGLIAVLQRERRITMQYYSDVLTIIAAVLEITVSLIALYEYIKRRKRDMIVI